MSLKTLFFSDTNCHKVINKFIDIHFSNSGKLLLKDDPEFLKTFKKIFLKVFNESASGLPTKSPAELSDAIAKLNARSIRLLEESYSEPEETLLEDLPDLPLEETPIRSEIAAPLSAQTSRELPAPSPVKPQAQNPVLAPRSVLKKRITIDNDMIHDGKVELSLKNVSEIELDSITCMNCIPNVLEKDVKIRYNVGGDSKELFTEWTTVRFREGYYQTRDLIQTLQKGASFGNYTFTSYVDDISGKLVFKGTSTETVKKPNSLAITAETKIIGFEMEVPESLQGVLGVNEDTIRCDGMYYCKLLPFSGNIYSLSVSIPEISMETRVPLDIPFGAVKWYRETSGVNTVFSNPRDISEMTVVVSYAGVLESSFELSLIIKKFI